MYKLRSFVVYAVIFAVVSVLAIFTGTERAAVAASGDVVMVLETTHFDDASSDIDSLLKRSRSIILSDVNVTETLHDEEYMARNIRFRVAGDSAQDLSLALSRLANVDNATGGFSDRKDAVIDTEWVYFDLHLVDVGPEVTDESVAVAEKPLTTVDVVRIVLTTILILGLFVSLVAVILWGGRKISYYFAHQDVGVERPVHSILDDDIETTKHAAEDSWYVDR